MKNSSTACEICTLDNCCLVAGLSQIELKKIETLANSKYKLKQGMHLYQINEKSTALYMIKTGALKSYLINKSGNMEIIAFHLPGELIGFESLHLGKHLVSAKCLQPTEVCEIKLESLLKIATEMPLLQRRIFNLMSQRLFSHIDADLRRNASQKIINFILELSKRFENAGYSATEFELPMTRQDIADYLKLTIETVSRIFSKLQDQSMIRVSQRKIALLNLKKLNDALLEIL